MVRVHPVRGLLTRECRSRQIMNCTKTGEIRGHRMREALPACLQIIATSGDYARGKAFRSYAAGVTWVYAIQAMPCKEALYTEQMQRIHCCTPDEVAALGYTRYYLYLLTDSTPYGWMLRHSPYVHRGPPTWAQVIDNHIHTHTHSHTHTLTLTLVKIMWEVLM